LIDFTEVLAANPPHPAWTRETALAVATALIDGTGFTLDWDRAAGEEWISLLSETARVGIVAARRPIAVLAEEGVPVITRAAGQPITVVTVPTFGDPVLVGDNDALRAAFGSGVDVMPFSADDLWFGTI
jgi:hypothetical protein